MKEPKVAMPGQEFFPHHCLTESAIVEAALFRVF